MTQAGIGILALACLAGGIWLGPANPRAVAETATGLLRPLALPQLWQGLRLAQGRGDPQEIAQRGREILRYLPDWTDGHLHFAAMLAFEGGKLARDDEQAADRLLAALAWLGEAQERAPGHRPELLSTMASFVEIRLRQTPGLREPFLRRTGQDPLFAAEAWLAQAEALAPAPSLSDRRAYLAVRLIASAVRMGDMARARLQWELAAQRLRSVRDPQDAQAWLDSLHKLGPVLRDEADADRAAIAADPRLAEIAEALAARR